MTLATSLTRIHADLCDKYVDAVNGINKILAKRGSAEYIPIARSCYALLSNLPHGSLTKLTRILDDKITDEIPLGMHLLLLHGDAASLDPVDFGFTLASPLIPTDKTCPFSVALAARPVENIFCVLSDRDGSSDTPIKVVAIDVTAPGFDKALTMMTICTGPRDVQVLDYELIMTPQHEDFTISHTYSTGYGEIDFTNFEVIHTVLTHIYNYFVDNAPSDDIDREVLNGVMKCAHIVDDFLYLYESLDDIAD